MARKGYKKISTNEDKEIVSFVSLLLFSRMNSIFKIGSERPLDENDLLSLSKENSSKRVRGRKNTEKKFNTHEGRWKVENRCGA